MKYVFALILVLFLLVGCTEIAQDNVEPVEDIPQKEKIVDTNEIVTEPIITEKQEVVEEIVTELLPTEDIILEKPIETQFYNDTKWMRINLQNVVTDETFTIESLKGQKIVVEIYSEQCYTCSEQKIKLREFIVEKNNSFKHISLNTDINAQKEKEIKYMDLHEYNWTFVLASKELRASIVEQFSTIAIKYGRAPLLLVCEDQSAHLLEGGIKGKHQLNEAFEMCG
mgnify:CR=1 FL=1